MLSALSAEGAEYLVVGAFALAAHGYPRATGDIDIWVRPSPANAARVMAALRRFGTPILGLEAADLEAPRTVFQVGVAPRRIDILTSIDGVAFDEAWEGRMEKEVEGARIPFIGRKALLRNKRSTGRPRDLRDAEILEGGPGTPPDGA